MYIRTTHFPYVCSTTHFPSFPNSVTILPPFSRWSPGKRCAAHFIFHSCFPMSPPLSTSQWSPILTLLCTICVTMSLAWTSMVMSAPITFRLSLGISPLTSSASLFRFCSGGGRHSAAMEEKSSGGVGEWWLFQRRTCLKYYMTQCNKMYVHVYILDLNHLYMRHTYVHICSCIQTCTCTYTSMYMQKTYTYIYVHVLFCSVLLHICMYMYKDEKKALDCWSMSFVHVCSNIRTCTL